MIVRYAHCCLRLIHCNLHMPGVLVVWLMAIFCQEDLRRKPCQAMLSAPSQTAAVPSETFPESTPDPDEEP